MDVILYPAILYLLATSLVLLRNQFDFKPLRSGKYSESKSNTLLVSILIPARNEADNIKTILKSALDQDYNHTEVIVLDDHSTDGTSEIIEELSKEYNNLYSYQGIEKPIDWLGKPWACHQLSKKATGDVFLFVDADVWFKSDTVSRLINEMKDQDMITVWPSQILGGFWEKMVIPLIYHALFTLLPSKYVERDPRWMPSFLSAKFKDKFAAACGQFIAIKRRAYVEIGGHRTVRNKIVEDVELAKKIKQMNMNLRMYHGQDQIYCRMYRSPLEIWEGLRKNFFIGFDKNIFVFAFMASLHIVVFILPFILLSTGIYSGDAEQVQLSLICILLIYIQRWTLDLKFSWNPIISLLHPFSVIWYQLLGLRCLTDHFLGINPTWKGREVTE